MAGTTNMPDLKTRLTLDITDFTRGLVDARAQAGLFSREIEGVTGHFRAAGVAMATFATVSLFTAGIVATSFMAAIGVLMTLGVVSAFQAQSVQAAWMQTGNIIRMGMLEAARAYVPVLERLAGATANMFVSVQPALTQVFDTLAPLFEDLSTEFLGWLSNLINAMPGMVNRAIAFLFSLGPAWDQMTDNMRQGWNRVYDTVLEFGPALMMNALPPLGMFVGNVLALLAPIIEFASEFAGPFLSMLAVIAGAAEPLLRDVLGGITPELIMVSGAMELVGLGIAAMFDGAEAPLSDMLIQLTYFGELAGRMFTDLNPTIIGLLQAAANTGTELMPVVKALMEDLVSFGPILVALADMVTAFARGFVRGIQPMLDAMGADWSGGADILRQMIPLMEVLGEAAGRLLTFLVQIVGIAIDIAAPFALALANLSGLFEATGIDAGRAIMVGIITGIGFMFGPTIGVIAGMVAAIAAFMPRSPAEVGPLSGEGSPDMRGRTLGLMFAEGIASSTGVVAAAAAQLAASVQLPSQPNAVGTPGMSLGGMLSGAVGAASSVVINVAGSILTDKDLQDLVQNSMLQRESRNAGSVFATSVRS